MKIDKKKYVLDVLLFNVKELVNSLEI